MKTNQTRPPVTSVKHASEFSKWYWPVKELHCFCEILGLSKSGCKADLRLSIENTLQGKPVSTIKKKPKCTVFDWAKEELSQETPITDGVSFGPNFRRFFKEKIGSSFVCHSDFMDWVKSNAGKTLADAIEIWKIMEQRKDDPGFRRDIALCNNYLQYLRDIRDANPHLSFSNAKKCWKIKSTYPAKDGIVLYEKSDLELLKQQEKTSANRISEQPDLSCPNALAPAPAPDFPAHAPSGQNSINGFRKSSCP